MWAFKLKLRACRVQAGYSQREVSEAIGVSEQTVVRWETGKKSPTMVQGVKLSDLYQIPIEYMDFSKEANTIFKKV